MQGPVERCPEGGQSAMQSVTGVAERGAPPTWLWRLASVPSVLVGMYLVLYLHMGFEGLKLSGHTHEPAATSDPAAGARWAVVVLCTWLPSLYWPGNCLWWVLTWGWAAFVATAVVALIGHCAGPAAGAVLASMVWTVAHAYSHLARIQAPARDGQAPPPPALPGSAEPLRMPVAKAGLVAALIAVVLTAYGWCAAQVPSDRGRLVDTLNVCFALAMAPTLCAVVVGMWWRAVAGADLLFWRVLWAATIPHCALLLVCAAWPAAMLYLTLAVSQLWWTSSRPAPTAEQTDRGAMGSEDVARAGHEEDTGDAGATSGGRSAANRF